MSRHSNRAMYREAKGLPATLRPGRPVVAMCEWQDYNYAGRLPGSATFDKNAPLWTDYGHPEQVACRASLGDERLTVWLPKGARILLRVVTGEAMDYTYTHVYGTHERMTRTRIRIRLVELPGQEVAEQACNDCPS